LSIISIIYILAAVPGTELTASRGGSQDDDGQRSASKNYVFMKFDLIAAFYKNANGKEPVFRVPVNEIHASYEFMLNRGFKSDDNSTPGYCDFIRTVNVKTLRKYVGAGFEEEVDMVLDLFPNWGRIELWALMLEPYDDEGHYPPRGLMVSDIFIEFTGTGHCAPVVFTEVRRAAGEAAEAEGQAFGAEKADGAAGAEVAGLRSFEIPLILLKQRFGCLTMFEVMQRFKDVFDSGNPWTLEELRECLTAKMPD